ncbi:PREDICTED: nuclear pore glycoprotein p62 [Dinoponera quadriceps]|uniref:Nuclear pore glycoprotein p62 n=1 Tax=Dinoponera quadriceps TaxID=609295 RepID=A0A6P3Y0I0_DINQU|nr:PREDICTED: nuclear pore glycoprotein p62 [Dinoponera quadriceps]XP_014484306.1 PREDICTED: nuclear pore glycoprotein p62 [Dinoponera quadriceps]
MTTPPNSGLSFGTPKTTTGITGLTFGTPTTMTSGTTFGLSSNTIATTTALSATPNLPNFALTSNVTPTSGVSLSFDPAKVSTTTTTATGFPLATTTAGGFSFGVPAAKPLTGSTGLTFGTPNPMAIGTGFGLGSTTTTTTSTTTVASAPSFNLTSSSAPTPVSGLSFDASKTGTTTAASTGFSLAITTVGGFSFGVGTTATTSTAFPLSKTTSAAISTSLTAPAAPHTSLGTTTTVTSATGIQPAAINFCQLEESINKWTLELEEQEKVFVNQATQVNVWDKLLITNGEKIVILNQEVERVKFEQQQLEHELDYVIGQQKELQECLVPLEKELALLSVSDPDREYTYRLSENLDTQLKRMSEDLKEIIEHLNEANRAQDSSDPIVQIGKILNAHMNSLQWLDQQTSLLSQKIQQIDQMHQNFRQESEQNLHLAYN